MKYKVSVIIPVYNMGRYLPECLDSVLSQDIDGLEVICVNDGSTDDSLQIMRRYAATRDNIVIIDKENAGVSAARNDGIEAAKGEFVAFMDPDDYYPHERVLGMLYAAAVRNHVEICGGNGLFRITPFAKRVLYHSFYNQYCQPGLRHYKDFQYDFGFTCYIFKLDLLRKHAVRFPLYTAYEDPVFFVGCMLASDGFYLLDELVYCHRLVLSDKKLSALKTIDMLKGVKDVLSISRTHDLPLLHFITLQRLMSDACARVKRNLANEDLGSENVIKLIAGLVDASSAIDAAWLAAQGYDVHEPFVLDIFKEALTGMQPRLRRFYWRRRFMARVKASLSFMRPVYRFFKRFLFLF